MNERNVDLVVGMWVKKKKYRSMMANTWSNAKVLFSPLLDSWVEGVTQLTTAVSFTLHRWSEQVKEWYDPSFFQDFLYKLFEFSEKEPHSLSFLASEVSSNLRKSSPFIPLLHDSRRSLLYPSSPVIDSVSLSLNPRESYFCRLFSYWSRWRCLSANWVFCQPLSASCCQLLSMPSNVFIKKENIGETYTREVVLISWTMKYRQHHHQKQCRHQ